MTTTSPSPAPADDRIVVRYNTNVDMSRGKMAAHVAHAVLTAAGVHPGGPIIVLGGKPRDIEQMTTVMHDEGRTELEPGTLTTGTDFVFASRARREQATRDLMQIVATTDDPTIASRISAAVELLGA
ncbi:hypothetical protein [Microbacterium sp. 77mftsu3.1]|uniref:hypothetical protein n=1 Tax=Microbacterium sp. 77mftsu3.1 TaxID=1761802 RepID=UPI00036A4E3E|nr:hypothetical protein [Microbacterium sp. 77mftsu3.1]SDH38364.1 peptidyl-tRNA hydrolase, PTH2 family [Microbacterium sp. 77mftsu3.1]